MNGVYPMTIFNEKKSKMVCAKFKDSGDRAAREIFGGKAGPALNLLVTVVEDAQFCKRLLHVGCVRFGIERVAILFYK